MRNHGKLNKVYYTYFTEYLLFSNQYKVLLQEGVLDVDIDSGYVAYLDLFVDLVIEENRYPLEIIKRLVDFILTLKEYIKEEEQIQTLDGMLGKMDDKVWEDSREVYYYEYHSRYATVSSSKNYDMIPERKLIIDIQNDFRYLNALIMRHEELQKCIGDDFLFFLNKLMCDYPEVVQDIKMKNRIICILKEKNLPNSEKYITMLSDNTHYSNSYGFDLTRVECLYYFAIIQKLLYAKNIYQELERIPIIYFYQENFLASLKAKIDEYKDVGEIAKNKKLNLKEILFYMRIHMEDILFKNKEKVISIINEGLSLLNTLKITTTYDIDYQFAYCERLGHHSILYTVFLFHNAFKKEEAKEHIDYLISLTLEVFDYLLDKVEENTFSTRNPIYESEIDSTDYIEQKTLMIVEKDIIGVLEYLFKRYPRMFFDDVIYRQAMSLLDCIDLKETEKLKKKIYKIRKDN